MAKAEDIHVDPFEPYARAGARIVRVRADELVGHAVGVLDTSDIERVHDMRVASRRLRAVLEIYAVCFPKAEYRSVLRDVKRVADALGERRDPDVHIDAMQAFAAAQPAAGRPGIERLTEDLRERQERGNAVLAAELDRMRERDLHGRLMALADAAEASVAAAGEEEAGAGDQVPTGNDGVAATAEAAHDGAVAHAAEDGAAADASPDGAAAQTATHASQDGATADASEDGAPAQTATHASQQGATADAPEDGAPAEATEEPEDGEAPTDGTEGGA
jgi:hypothetical protein